MLQESKDTIIKHFVTLMKDCNVDVLKDTLVNKGVFSTSEITKIFSSPDARHNKRLFFFNIQHKEQRAFDILVDSLKATNQHKIANILVPSISGCKPYRIVQETNEDVTPGLSMYVDSRITPLDINVVMSNQLYDTATHNEAVHFYSSRSKKRGKLLIINNYEYNGIRNYRNGAIVDNNNLQKLFEQMGGWEICKYDNKEAQEMKNIVKQFAQDPESNQYDICFVIVMAHGNEISNETIIHGTDGDYVYANDIQKEFTNEKCRGYRGKPKIFLFQVCRGDHIDRTIRHTETDSIFRETVNTIVTDPPKKMTTNIRTEEDMLIGYATLHGFKAHRHPNRGSWYIELVCQKFMDYAHNHSVDDLLKLVDQGLRIRMSEDETMQTAEHCNKGFKKLYLNPGIYYENGEVKNFNS